METIKNENKKITMSPDTYTIMRYHFNDGTFFDKRLDHSKNSGCGTTIDQQMREDRSNGYIFTLNGRVPYHNVVKVTDRYCKTVQCPCCGTIGYTNPD